MRASTAIALLVLAACGPKTPEPPKPKVEAPDARVAAGPAPAGAPNAAAPANPCAAISEAEASAALGHAMKYGRDAPPGECVLVSASGDKTKSVSVKVVPGRALFDAMAATPGARPVAGIGDKAVTIAPNLVLAVKGGSSYLGGIYDGANPAQMMPKSIELAKKVVARI